MTGSENGSADAHTPKNILITGGAGFIASHVVLRFVKNYPQYKIVNLDKLDYCSSLLNLKELENSPNYKFVKGNVCSSDFVTYILASEEIDTILHFAAQTHVDNSFGNSFQFTENNILGTHTLLEASKVYGKIKRFVHVSTDEVYGEIEAGEGFEHSTILQPTNPYAATKAGAEFLVQAYHNSFKLPTIITRGNNVYGPHQYPEKLIPKFICLLSQDKPCFIHGDGSNRRNFLFVEDVASAFDTITHKGLTGNVYNIGTDFEISNLDVARLLLKAFGKDEKTHIQFVENRPFNDCRYKINSDKLLALGWRPQVSWEEGIQRTIDWYKNNTKNWISIEAALVPHPRAGQKAVTHV
jgi:UDP-glucose 4,6-dehydratase